jgi:class 3 adenylate cyclase
VIDIDLETPDPENKPATVMVMDLRNSTALHRLLVKKPQRLLIVEMMIGIHKEVIRFLFEESGVSEANFAFNDTGDGYIIAFTDPSHAISCLMCALHLRSFLVEHLDKLNHALKIKSEKLRYSFGIGVHSAFVRLIRVEYKVNENNHLSNTLMLGNAANSACRVESMTKNFAEVDLLLTGYTRQLCQQQANKKVKKLFEKEGTHLIAIGDVRHLINDSKPNGHTLFTVSQDFYDVYKQSVIAL